MSMVTIIDCHDDDDDDDDDDGDDDDDDYDDDDDDDDDCSVSTSRLWGKWLLLAHDSSGNSSLSSTNSYNNPKVAEALKTRGAL